MGEELWRRGKTSFPIGAAASLAGPLAATVAANSLGLEGVDSATILRWYDAIVDAVTGVAAGHPVTPAGRAAFAALRSSVEPMFDSDCRSSLVAAACGLTLAEV